MTQLAYLPARGIIRLAGPDTQSLLQGIVTNDVTKIVPDRAIYAALLTPQGKFLFDFFLAQAGDALLMDAEAARLADLERRLKMYRLRAQVEIAPLDDDWAVAAVFGDGATSALDLADEAGAARAFGQGAAFVDPRRAELGARIVAPKAEIDALVTETALSVTDAAAYDRHRLAVGVPDSSRDYEVEKTLALEANLDLLNGVDFHKGCYVGQELTARTHFRGKVRYRLYPVRVEGPVPEPGTPVTADEKKVGEMRSAGDGVGLAFLRGENIEEGKPLAAGETTVTPLPLAGAESDG
jgi:folate-binding protein YgfZ